jgi:hypothetical protein
MAEKCLFINIHIKQVTYLEHCMFPVKTACTYNVDTASEGKIVLELIT